LSPCSDQFPGRGLSKDPTAWLDGARPTQISQIMDLTNPQFDQL
jgi:hypothetical protein